MSHDPAFAILSRRRHDPTHREVDPTKRIQAFVRQHQEARRDPMTHDLVGWDLNLAQNSPWPWCARCKTVVKAYGVENRDQPVVTVWAKCHGNKRALEVEKPHKDIYAQDPQWLARRLRYLVFFAE